MPPGATSVIIRTTHLFNERYQVTNLEPAKLKLIEARTASERVNAIQFAMEHGMALQEIEQYLDWLDFVQGPPGEPVPDLTNLDSDEGERSDCGE